MKKLALALILALLLLTGCAIKIDIHEYQGKVVDIKTTDSKDTPILIILDTGQVLPVHTEAFLQYRIKIGSSYTFIYGYADGRYFLKDVRELK